MTDSRVSETASQAGDVVQREETLERPTVVRSGWTPGRITALVIGAILLLGSIGLLAAGGWALWLDQTWRDGTGYVTTSVHEYSTAGSALVTESAELASPGVDWLYSSVVLGNVRIRVTPLGSDSPVFVGIGPSDQVDRYVTGMRHTVLSGLWRERAREVPGGTPASPPEAQDLWVASANGAGPQSLTWDAANGSWSVVVMNADGRPGVSVGTDLGATFPTLLAIAIGSLVGGTVILSFAVLIISRAIRRRRVSPVVTV